MCVGSAHVTVVLSGDAFSPALRLLDQRRRLHTKPSLHLKNVWQVLGVCCLFLLTFQTSDGLKIIDPGFISCDEIGKLLFVIQSTLVISKSKGPSETLRDIRTSTYQMYRIEENTNRTTKFHKLTCNLTPLVRNVG